MIYTQSKKTRDNEQTEKEESEIITRQQTQHQKGEREKKELQELKKESPKTKTT